ncbi:MAG TPA: T9SS type A sorting domain-containing protein [Leeuwenhoekiella sp.]|nr:T9SS type A sorting domain-containing protein [Leeuwenhoekiella sp.]
MASIFQRWGFEEIEPGYYKISSKNGGKVLDVAQCSTADGANVQQFQWVGGDCQRWGLNSTNSLSLNVNKNNAEEQLTIIPNPASTYFEIATPTKLEFPVQIELFNSLGNRVKSEVLKDNSLSKRMRVNLDGISSGVYMVRFFSRGMNVSKKLIIR